MEPDRKSLIKGYKIEEFYWNGRQVVYVNNRLTDLLFDEACDVAAKEESPIFSLQHAK